MGILQRPRSQISARGGAAKKADGEQASSPKKRSNQQDETQGIQSQTSEMRQPKRFKTTPKPEISDSSSTVSSPPQNPSDADDREWVPPGSKRKSMQGARKNLSKTEAKLPSPQKPARGPLDSGCSEDSKPKIKMFGDVKRKSSFDLDIDSIRRRYDVAAKNLEKSSLEQKRLASELDAARQEILKRDAAIECGREECLALELETKKLLKEKQELQKLNTERGNELGRLLNERLDATENTFKVTDDTILGEWLNMSFRIRNLVSSILGGKSNIPSLTAPTSSYAANIAEHCRAQPELQPFLLQRFIWRVIHREIFGNTCQAWAGSLGSRFVASCQAMQAVAIDHVGFRAAYSNIKSRAAQDLEKEFGKNTDIIERIAKGVVSELFIFGTGHNKAQILEDTSIILNQALNLQSMFLQSRAIFNISDPFYEPSPGTTWRLHKNSMEVTYATVDIEDVEHPSNDDPTIVVTMVVAPSLIKVGNADGERFECRLVLCKAKVVLGQLEFGKY